MLILLSWIVEFHIGGQGQSFSTYSNFSRKLNIFYPLIHLRTVRIRGQKMSFFSENSAHLLIEWPLILYFMDRFNQTEFILINSIS